MGIWPGWWESPEASATIAVALIAGLFAVYQLRAFPADRKRRILDRMVEKFAESKDSRGVILGASPPLMVMGYAAIRTALDAETADVSAPGDLSPNERAALAEAAERTRTRLRNEARIWDRPSVGIGFTAAQEVLASEFKFRSLLWAIEQIRDSSPESHVLESHREAATRAIESLNDFGTDYENGAYPARTLFGLTHRGMATASKALEPYIWANSLNGRWGRRVIRLGLAAQHFNDVTAIHRSNSITWTSRFSVDGVPADARSIVVHPALTMSVLAARSWMLTRFQLHASCLYSE